MLNRVMLIGFVGKKPEIRKTQKGDEIVHFSLATFETWNNKQTGEKQRKTEWHAITVFNKTLIELAKKYIDKGNKIYIEGTLQSRTWLDKEEKQRKVFEIVLQGFQSKVILLNNEDNQKNELSNSDDEMFD